MLMEDFEGVLNTTKWVKIGNAHKTLLWCDYSGFD